MTCRIAFSVCRNLTLAIAAATALAATPVSIPPAHAEILQLAAAAFSSRAPDAVEGEVQAGMLQNATGKFYASVPFARSGRRVCRFTLIYRDNDIDHDVSARLMRKAINIGGSAFDGPLAMAEVTSTGAVDTMRRASTKAISKRVVSTRKAIYFVEIEFPFEALQAIGVQIDYRTKCP